MTNNLGSKEKFAIKIRKVKKKDLPAIKKICENGFPKDDAYEIAKALIPVEHFYAVENSRTKKLLGFIAFGIHSLRTAHIIILAIDKQYQRKGIGSILLDHALQVMKKTSIEMVRLEVRTTNASAIKFYEKFGFRVKTSIKEYYDDFADAYLMIKEI